ncbi:hypothetical protein J437_LFUL007201 [Ladona fulva]|uniref:Uncharacterized protein n=1 Tax=Ladona fulva TaxID=123851 RepID=A0A8K0K455_LADFU|nr:hypothetical protein J437_LFUL007201 [Ladona fulva]
MPLYLQRSSKSYKDILLHNSNKYPSLPSGSLSVLYSVEEYNSIKSSLDALKYDMYSWISCNFLRFPGLVKNYDKMGFMISLKVNILDAHLGKFKENVGMYSEEQIEPFHLLQLGARS